MEKTNLQGKSPGARVSSVTCHVTCRVYGMQGAIGFFNKKETFLFRLRAEAYDFALVSVCLREWNCKCPIE